VTPPTVLVVGGGGREHAITRSLAAVPGLSIIAAPGNPGIAGTARLVDVAADDVPGVVAVARSEDADLVIPGPEAPLVTGLADALAEAGIACCGPSAAAARLEGSKAFTRELASRAGVPGPAHRVVSDPADLDAALSTFTAPPVVKADGLAAGKGVSLPGTMDGCRADAVALLAGRLGDAGRRVVLEERLVGTEASLFYACRGTEAIPLPHARDHKRLRDGDRGPNTGGMGAVSPDPVVDDALERVVRETIVGPTLEELARSGIPFSGFLFAGLMLAADGPRLLEYNVRLGDPEAQAILPRVAGGDLLEVCRWVAGLRPNRPAVAFDPRPVCAVVVAADGYPEAPRRGDTIHIDPLLEGPDRWFDHAGTRLVEGTLTTAGGRVGAVVARADTAAAARSAAYEGVDLVTFAGKNFREDIGSAP
jgi:phosphoribosylamine--glycine ligase